MIPRIVMLALSPVWTPILLIVLAFIGAVFGAWFALVVMYHIVKLFGRGYA